MKFRTKLLEFDKKNKNGRIYPKELFNKEIIKYFNDKNKPKYGEFDRDGSSSMDISFNRISHVVENIEMDDEAIYGDVKILNTLNGNIVKDLLDNGYSVGVASRGMGTINEKGEIENYKLLTFDLVSDPAFDIYLDPYEEKKNINEYVKKIDILKEEWATLKLNKD